MTCLGLPITPKLMTQILFEVPPPLTYVAWFGWVEYKTTLNGKRSTLRNILPVTTMSFSCIILPNTFHFLDAME